MINNRKRSYSRFTLLLIAVIVCCGSKAQDNINKEYKLVSLIKTFETLSKINNTTDEEENFEKIFRRMNIIGVFTTDSIIIYDDFNKDASPDFYYLQKEGNNKLLLHYKHTSDSDSLVYLFDNEKNRISINDNQYYLSPEYFDYLYRKGYEGKNILPLIGLLTSGVEDFSSYDVLINNLWFLKDVRRDYKILKSEIIVDSPHSDMKYKFNISYSYDDQGYITRIKKISDDEYKAIYLDLKLICKNSETSRYESFRLDDGDRYSENSKLSINTKKMTHSIYTERQQAGFAYTYISATTSRKEYHVSKLNLTNDGISGITKNDTIISEPSPY